MIKKLSEIIRDNKNLIENLIMEVDTYFDSLIIETTKMLNFYKAKCTTDMVNLYSKAITVEYDKIEQIFENFKQIKLETEVDVKKIIKNIQILEDDLIPTTSKIINEIKPIDVNQLKTNYEIIPKDFSKKFISTIYELRNTFEKKDFSNLSSLIQNPILFKILDFEQDLIVSSNIKLKADLINQFNRVIIQKGGVLSVDPWNGNNGGRLIILSNSFVINENGRINVDGCGYKGGLNAEQGGGEGQSFSGESWNGVGIKSIEPNNGGGGGGPMSGNYGSIGGGGGGYGTQGNNSEPNKYSSGNRAGGKGGMTYGDEEMSIIYMGSGGGGGAPYTNGGNKAKGGNGGGVLTMSFINEGIISADGENGEDSVANTFGSSGGGGSGGSIFVVAKSIDKQGELSVKGGKGGNWVDYSSTPGTSTKGGEGGFGRIKVRDFTKFSNVKIMGLEL